MGCVQSCLSPTADDLYGLKQQGADQEKDADIADGSDFKPGPHSETQPSPRIPAAVSLVLQPDEILQLADTVATMYFPGEANAVQLAAIAVVESSGRMGGSQHSGREERIGICNVRLSVAELLAAQDGCAALGPPSPMLLAEPQANLYYCAAHMRQLQHGYISAGEEDVEQAAVRAYGGRTGEQATAYWQRYSVAKQRLQLLADAIKREHQVLAQQSPGPQHRRSPRLSSRPRLHALQPGESLPDVARQHRLLLDHLLQANQDLVAQLGRVTQGWLLQLPQHGAVPSPVLRPPTPSSSRPPTAPGSANGSNSQLRTITAAAISSPMCTHSTPLPGSRTAQAWAHTSDEPAWLRQHLMADAASARRDQQGAIKAPWAPGGSPGGPSGPTSLKQVVTRSGPRRGDRQAMSMALPKIVLD